VGVYTRAPAGTFTTRDEHRPAHKPARQAAYEANLLSRAERIGPGHWTGLREPSQTEASAPIVSSRA
jgi:hypothetical protein